MPNIEMVIDSIRVSLMNYERVAILEEKEVKKKAAKRYLPIWIGPSEADQIAVVLQDVHVPRPLTHDFVCTIIDHLGGVAKAAIISELKNDTFYAKLVINIDKEQIEIDCRPSDALAVAVRRKIPIFVDEKVLKIAGIYLDPETGKPIEEALNLAELPAQAPTSTAIPAKKEDVEPSHFEIFSEATQHVLNKAESEAKRLNQNFIGTGHLLMALLKEGHNAKGVLRNMGIDLDKLQTDVEVSLIEQKIEEGETGLTSAVKHTIELSINEAKHLGSDQVQPEHLLISLASQDDGIAAKLLNSLKIDSAKIYIELIKIYTLPWQRY